MVRRLALNLAIALAYWGIAHLNHLFFASHGVLPMPIWPSAAIAIAVAIRWGWGAAPGIALGTLLANGVSLASGWPVALGITVMNTLAPLLAAWGIRRVSGEHFSFSRVGHVTAFILLAGFMAPLLASLGGMLTLSIFGRIAPAQLFEAGIRWWIAHASGTLLFAPGILCWWADHHWRDRREAREFLAVAGATVALALWIFSTGHRYGESGLHFLLIIPLAWSAVRFPPRETLTLSPLLMVIALGATVMGIGPFADAGHPHPLATVAILGLAWGAAIFFAGAIAAERLELADAHIAAAKALQQSEQRLQLTLEAGELGMWDWNVVTGKVVFNDRLVGILGYEPGELAPHIDSWSGRLHPDDQARVTALLQRHLEAATPHFQAEYRMRHRDGGWRWILDHGRVVERDDAGRPLRAVGVHQDVTPQREAQEALADREEQFRTIVEQAEDGICLVDVESAFFTEFNEAAHRNLGYTREEFGRLRVPDIESAESPEQVKRHFEYILQNGGDTFESRHRAKDGSIRTVRVSARLVTIKNRRYFACLVADISESKRVEAQLRLLASVFEHSGEAILVTDDGNRIVAVNRAFTRLTGYRIDDIKGQNPRILSAGRTSREEYRAMWEALSGRGYWQGEIWDRRKDGSVYPKWLSIASVRNERQEVVNYIASFSDITERKEAEERIRHLAHHDSLTGLLNRFSLESRLEQVLGSAERGGEQAAVMFIDMDRFKYINDTLGHHVGDGLLVEVAQRLADCVRKSDVVARLGGDEFVVVVTEVTSRSDVEQVADKMLETLRRPYLIQGRELHSSPSIGIGLFPEDGTTAEMLMRNADTAMYYAKENGRNSYQFFAVSMSATTTERLRIESDLRQAMERGELALHYQPQVDAHDGRVVGFEALIRWMHPLLGLVSPIKFIPIAEETGLIVPLGEWVLEEACRQLRIWRDSGIKKVKVAVNLSAHQLRSPILPTLLAGLLERYALSGEDLELEVTESVAMDKPELTIELLRRFREMGVKVAIDDFGTGYSSLSYLKLLPIQCLKIDRSFVKDIETDPNDAAICAATVALAHSLGLELVAEGVETESQRDYLRDLGCDQLQGYLFSRPLPPEEAAEYIVRNLEAVRAGAAATVRRSDSA